MEPFPVALDARIAASGMSKRQFAAKVRFDQASLTAVLKGRRKPPLDRLDAWCDALDLSGQAREDLLVAGWLAHSPERLADFVERLRSQARRRR